MSFLYASVFVLAAWKWGDWKNWHRYYSTILFFILGDLLYQFLFHDYSMWEFQAVGVDKRLGMNHTVISLSIMFIKYPSVILIYLGRFPQSGRWRQLVHILIWVGIFTVNELLTKHAGGIFYAHGWSTPWSILFAFVMLVLLRLHYKRPLMSWGVSVLFIILLWSLLDVPYHILK